MENKDICIRFNFEDSDFKDDILFAGEQYVKRYEALIEDIESNKHSTPISDYYRYQLIDLEKMSSIKTMLKLGFLAHLMVDTYVPALDYTFSEIIRNNVRIVGDIQFDNDKLYMVGTYDEINEQVLELHEYKSCIAEVENINITNIMENDTCLYIMIKDGKMNAWIR